MRLKGSNEIDWVVDPPQAGIESKFIYFGQGGAGDAIQIALASATSKPSRTTLKALFQARRGKLQIKLLVAVTYEQSAYLFGPDPDAEVLELSDANAENVLNAILLEPSGVFAYRRAVSLRKAFQSTEITGFNNNGLFASHYLRTSTETHPKWLEYAEGAKILKDLRHMELINGLGFAVTGDPASTLILKVKGEDKKVVAVLLDQNESFDAKSNRFQASPVEWGLGMATEQGAPWLIAIRDAQIRLYPAKDGVGVGQKSQVETYFEVDLLTLDEEKAALLPLIFSAEALAERGTVDEFLRNSQKFASELGIRLRERVYESIVPVLSKEIANQLRTKGHQLDSAGLQLSYELTLRILFRMLFQAYAEDRGLLPAGRNERFDKNSMKSWADDFLESDEVQGAGDSSSLWYDLMQVWDAIDQGSSDMQIPAYNGGLFGIDPELHPAGHLIRSLSIPDRVMKPALKALLIDDHTEDGVAGKVDFRSLSVREFGTIYEGLLESSLSVAEQDLTVDKKGAWVPAKEGEAILASANEVYFHSASGERKATGSYYTPSFVVDHLIERSVEPALKAHLAKVKIKIDAGDQLGAYEDFFDFRVADLAMGSAHFLVAAIDKIEAVMRSFLIQEGNRVDGVEAELMRLENAAKLALGDDEAAYAEIERSSLLRRQIARRCIYGLDINPLAVELSRLAIWIHTFVPGLPMSSLEHGLVCANSLTGIGSVEEGLNALIPQREKVGTSLFDGVVEESLTMARDLLIDLANADEADKAGAKRAVEIAGEARQAASKSKLMFDLAVANRSGVLSSGGALSEEDLRELYSNEELSSFVNETNPAHMPYLFPEVFLKTDPGFDAVLGNPPWERPFMDKTRFWAARSPGLLGLRVEVRNRKIEELEAERPDLAEKFDQEVISADRVREVLSSRFNLGVGHADLYKAFGWVALSLICRGAGRIAFVLPKTAFSAAGGEHWRRALQSQGSISELTYLVNTGRWAFDIEGRYSIALMVYTKGLDEDLLISGPVHSRAEFELLPSSKAVKLDRNLLMSFTETASIPSVRDQRTAEVLQKMRKSPSLKNFAGGKFRPVSELNATTDRPSFDHGASEGRLPVMSGRSFNIWQPDAGPMFAWADSEVVVPILNRKLERQMRLRSSAFYGFDLEKDLGGLHPLFRPRIAFRAITNPTNSRTFICALVPPERILTHISPYILTPIGNEAQESYLLGVMSSLIFDWYTRKFIETAADLHLVRAFPIPEISDERLSSRITQLAGNLAAVDKRYFDWANRAGVSMGGGLTDSDRISLVAELDGLVALAYRLNTDDLRHLYASFHRGWTDPVRLEIAASTMENWG